MISQTLPKRFYSSIRQVNHLFIRGFFFSFLLCVPSFGAAWGNSLEELGKQAAEGSLQAMVDLGKAYTYGKGTPVDYGKALQWLSKAAEQNNPTALTELGALYENGLGVKQDFVKAFSFYTNAAELGYDDGQRALGVMYELGKGVVKAPSKAAFWYQKAAEQGLARAQANLGYLYENGIGVTKDYEKALYWYAKSAAQPYPRGQTFLGKMYERGLGVERDTIKAVFWYQKAAGLGYKKAEQYLHALGEGKKKFKETEEEQAAKANDSLMTNSMKQDEVQASLPSSSKEKATAKGKTLSEEQVTSPAQNRNEDGQVYFNLGLKYFNGEGVQQSAERAAYWFEQAERRGNLEAVGYLAKARTMGTSLPQRTAGVEKASPEQGSESTEKDKLMAKQLFYLGNDYARESRYDMAATAFKKALILDPENKNSKENLAVVLAKTGDVGRGIELMREVVIQSPEDASKQSNLGIMLQSAGKLDEALSAYRLALKQDPALASVYHGMAVIFAQQHNPASAWQAIVMAKGLGLGEDELLQKIEIMSPKPVEDCASRQNEQFCLRRIVTDTRQKATEIRSRLIAGESFTELVATDGLPKFAEKGGFMGIFSTRELEPKIELVIREMAPFSYSEMVEMDGEFHIFQKIPLCRELLE